MYFEVYNILSSLIRALGLACLFRGRCVFWFLCYHEAGLDGSTTKCKPKNKNNNKNEIKNSMYISYIAMRAYPIS